MERAKKNTCDIEKGASGIGKMEESVNEFQGRQKDSRQECFQCRGNHLQIFKNAVSTWDINENSSIINQNFKNFDNTVDRAIEMYKYHPSIILINQKIGNQNKFSFEPIDLSDVVKEINDINTNKLSGKDSIPPEMLKISSEASQYITKTFKRFCRNRYVPR